MNKDACCEKSLALGALVGGLIGLGLGVWTHLQFVKPSFDDINAMNNSQDANLTVAIAFLGVVEVIGFTCAGLVTGLGISALGAKLIGCNNDTKQESANKNSFFKNNVKIQTHIINHNAQNNTDKDLLEEHKCSEESANCAV